uniref:Potassium channel blocker AbKTx-9 n=1 Tax=Androctonus bicolor TaxID=748906 RepID=A0A0K0LC06_9SCOR|nr:potassium channel blocker AbKTx-9 [Androctonus bicolor]
MQRNLVVLLFLGMVALSSCGLREKHVQKLVKYAVPAGTLRTVLQTVVHKLGKTQFGCPVYQGYCDDHCQDIKKEEGFCHASKCKCGIPMGF